MNRPNIISNNEEINSLSNSCSAFNPTVFYYSLLFFFRLVSPSHESDISLPIELNTAQHIAMAREFTDENFVSKGVCADFNIHDDKTGNPHFHLQLTMRDVDENGFGGRRKEEQGNLRQLYDH